MKADILNELAKLHDEYTSDVTLSLMNLEEQNLKAPAIKAKWVKQLWQYEFELKELESKLEEVSESHRKLVRSNLKVGVTEEEFQKAKLKATAKVEKLQERIDGVTFIITYLRKYQNLVAFYGNDIKNALDYQKLERL